MQNKIAIQKQKMLTGSFYLCCLFPFVSPIPIQTDTQPPFLIIATIIVLMLSWQSGLRTKEYLLICVSVMSLIYINPLIDYKVDIGKSISVVAGILTFIAASRVEDKTAFRVAKLAAIVYFSYSVLIYLDSDYFLGLQEHFVRAVNADDIEYRGSPALATEPGLLGGLLVFLLIQLLYYGRKVNASRNELVIFVAVIFSTIAMTKSGTGYLYLLIFLILSYVERSSKSLFLRLLIPLFALIILLILMPMFENVELNNRGLDILISLASGGDFGHDTSILKRIYDLLIGMVSLFNNPLGVGINGVSDTVNRLAIQYDLLRPNDLAGEISLVSGLGYYLVSYGFVGVIFMLYFFLFVSRASMMHKLFAMIFLSASYSPAFPAIWILLSQCSLIKKRIK